MSEYVYISSDGSGGDLRAGDIQASGIGEAAQIAYGITEDEDRECVAVISFSDWESVYKEMPNHWS